MKYPIKLLIALMFLTNTGYAQLVSATYGLAGPGPIPKGAVNAPILKLKITMGSGIILDSLTWNTMGCTSYVADVILNSGKIFYSDSNSTFSTSFPFFNNTYNFGMNTVIFPVTLYQGDNYLWLTYDISPSATPGHCLSARIDSLYFEGMPAISPVFIPDSFNCIEVGNAQTTAINDLSNPLSPINLYPNPTNSVLKINIPSINNSDIIFRITDCLGQTVFQKSHQYSKQMEYDLSSIATGIYVAEIIHDGKSYYSKLIKE